MTQDQLDAYFRRINFTPPAQPGLQALANLQWHHATAIPFENLNPLLGIPVLLDSDTLFHKIVTDQRGGYCFEQNVFFLEVLRSLGFNSRGLTGRVLEKERHLQHRTHMLILTELDGRRYISDVGFGSDAPCMPLLLDTAEEQKTRKGVYRLQPEENGYVLQDKYQDKWRRLYFFDLMEQYPTDFEVGNWYTSTYPTAGFRNHLVLSIKTEECRYTLYNNVLTAYYPDRPAEKKSFHSPEEIRKLMTGLFKIRLHNLPGLDKKLRELIEKAG